MPRINVALGRLRRNASGWSIELKFVLQDRRRGHELPKVVPNDPDVTPDFCDLPFRLSLLGCEDRPVGQSITIDQVLEAFLEDQRRGLSARTMRNYDYVIELLRHSLNGYAYTSLDNDDTKRFEEASRAGDEEAFCHLFGPEHILGHLGEFLGYFMVRKVMGGQELLRSAGTVTKKLAGWLYAQGYVSDDEREGAVERGTEASRDLPRAERLASLLYDQSRSMSPPGPHALAEKDYVEGYLVIERVEPGALYFGRGIGPLPVSEQASALAEVGWGINITLAQIKGRWRVVEVGNVYPM
jgi:hypothetical protein